MDERIRKMAEEVGCDWLLEMGKDRLIVGAELEAFARAIAADCAQIADELARDPGLEKFPFYHAQKAGTQSVATAIRARYLTGAAEGG